MGEFIRFEKSYAYIKTSNAKGRLFAKLGCRFERPRHQSKTMADGDGQHRVGAVTKLYCDHNNVDKGRYLRRRGENKGKSCEEGGKEHM